MSMSVSCRRALLGGLLAVLTATVTGVGAPVATAAPAPVATAMSVVLSELPGSEPPATPGAPDVLVVSGGAVTVTVRTFGYDGNGDPVALPASYTKPTTIAFSVTAPTGAPRLTATRSVVIPAAQASASSSSVVLTGAANRAVLTGTVTDGTKDAKAIPPAASASFDVVATKTSASSSATFWSTAGAAPCAPTATPGNTMCADLVLPGGALSSQVLTTGLCDSFLGCGSDKTVVQALVDLGTRYPRTAPATLIVKCDKSVCPGSSVSGYRLLVNLTPDQPLGSITAYSPDGYAPACPSKGVVGPDQSYCVDYVQSKRDNAGDTLLFLLFTEDARASAP